MSLIPSHPGPTNVASRRKPSPRLWLRVLSRRGQLDRELARGLPPVVEPELELRARQLTRPAKRRKLAESLRMLVAQAESPPRPVFTSALPVRREPVLLHRESLLEIAARLDHPSPISPIGVARVLCFLTDGDGPLFNRSSEQLMGEAVSWMIYGLRVPAADDDGREATAEVTAALSRALS